MKMKEDQQWQQRMRKARITELAGRPAFESARVETETSPAFEEGRKTNMNMIEQHFPCSLALRT
jgi:hypothetical protein